MIGSTAPSLTPWKQLDGDGAIAISRDAHGVPHIRADYETDLYRGLGWCHGTDRAMQLVLVQTLAAGRACERLADNDEMLDVDRFFRRMDFGRGADAELDKLPAAERTCIDAYIDGVNRALATSIPWELRAVGVKSATYTAADAIALSRLIAYVSLAQSQGDMERLLVQMVQGGVPRGHLEGLFPGSRGDLDPYLIRKVKVGEPLVPDAVRWLAGVPHTIGSNNWVISGTKTASGRAMLANDPHLEVNRLPSVWYEVVLEQGDKYFVGATMPGLPAAIIGRTRDLAWGVTYAFMDATDSWIEDCKDGCRKRFIDGEDRWVPFEVRNAPSGSFCSAQSPDFGSQIADVQGPSPTVGQLIVVAGFTAQTPVALLQNIVPLHALPSS